MKKILIYLSLSFVVLAQPGLMSVPNTISYQGMLTNMDGTIYEDGEYAFSFSLLVGEGTDQQLIWQEDHTVMVTNGVFAVLLGSIIDFPENIPPSAELMTKIGDEELSPRQPFSSVPFALKANRAQTALMALQADSANFALNSHRSSLSDTALVAMNAPMADSAQFAQHAQHSNHADSAMVSMQSNQSNFANVAAFSDMSQHSVHADTAHYVEVAQTAITANQAESAIQSTYSDTANYAIGIVGGIEINDVLNSTYSDTANFAQLAQNAETALNANQAEISNYSTYSDTAEYIAQAQSAISALSAETANNATYSDTAIYIQQAQTAITSDNAINALNSTYADTANFVNLMNNNQNIRVTKSDDARITLFSTGDGSSSDVSLVAQKTDGTQSEIRIMNDGGPGELKFYDASNFNDLVTVDENGVVSANSFIGDGSQLTA